jgi:excisionase family DNA binding protein
MSAPVKAVQPAQQLLTPDDVAAMLGISRVSVIRQSRAGKIPAIQIGKCYRYRESSLQAWLSSQETRPSA